MLDLDFEKKINFIIFKIHSAKKKAMAEPELPKFKLDENGEPIEDPNSSLNGASPKRLDPQTILISATFTSGIKEIARRLNVKDPVNIDISSAKQSRPDDEEDQVDDDDDKDLKVPALPAGLLHYYMVVPSKLRLIALTSFILDKLVVCFFLFTIKNIIS